MQAWSIKIFGLNYKHSSRVNIRQESQFIRFIFKGFANVITLNKGYACRSMEIQTLTLCLKTWTYDHSARNAFCKLFLVGRGYQNVHHIDQLRIAQVSAELNISFSIVYEQRRSLTKVLKTTKKRLITLTTELSMEYQK